MVVAVALVVVVVVVVEDLIIIIIIIRRIINNNNNHKNLSVQGWMLSAMSSDASRMLSTSISWPDTVPRVLQCLYDSIVVF